MTETFPKEFDLVVIGTGFPESCLAAAASRVGKTVLHVDPNDYYGSVWASFNLQAFCKLLEKEQNTETELCNIVQRWHCKDDVDDIDDTNNIQLGHIDSSNSQAKGDERIEEEYRNWTKASLMQQSRRFNIDLTPRVIYSAGDLVQLLISSNICRYAEFRAVDRVYTRFNDKIMTVPCSRADVFNTQALSIVEKRLLMKFLQQCMTFEDDIVKYQNRTFFEYLQGQQMTPIISTCVMQAIAMCEPDTPFIVGMQRTQLFLQGLGRYGNTPFLFPMYGCGEIPQCFCRLCAVFGGLYCLNRRVEVLSNSSDSSNVPGTIELILHEDHSMQQSRVGIEQQSVTITTKHIVCSSGNRPKALASQADNVIANGGGLSRGIFLTSAPLLQDDVTSCGGGVCIMRLLANANDSGGRREAILIQLSHYSGCCPKGVFIYHITTTSLSEYPESDLQEFIDQIFNPADITSTSVILYSAFFTIPSATNADFQNIANDQPAVAHCTAAPFYELDYDKSILNAQDIFKRLYGDDIEFLPRAPDPEEIVIDGEDPRALNEVNMPDDLRAQLRQLEEDTERMDIEDVNAENVSSNQQ